MIRYTHQNSYTGISYGPDSERGYLVEKVVQTEQEVVVPFLRFPMFDCFPEICCGYSTRLGGVSTGVSETMSFSVKCGDSLADIKENFRRISKALELSTDMVLTNQVHDTVVLPVTKANCCDEQYQSTLQGVDGIVTNQRGLTLVCFTADCVPLFFYDSVKKVIGVAHAGWRGTVGQIGQKTIEVMKQEYGTRPENVSVVIGPSICAECYEVDEVVAEQFRTLFSPDAVTRFLTPQVKEQIEPHYQLDLWQANKESLISAGVPRNQISISGICTCCNSSILHSHRATAGKRGLLAGFLSIR